MATPWTPWHQVVDVREDVLSGELTINTFAADLHDVIAQTGKRPIYEDASEFFKLTYPTHTLRELAREVAERLNGKSVRAVRQMEQTYGGGKTHTLITLRHLFTDPSRLPRLPAVDEFFSHIGGTPPQARVAAVPFDYLDTKVGMEVQSPEGERRRLKHPWSVIAYQLAGDEGLRILSGGEAEERDDPPATGTLIEVLSRPEKEGHATLVLIDEVLLYVHSKVASDRTTEEVLINFFQYLTQAVSKVDRCCMVASLLASKPEIYDTLGKRLESRVANIFRRVQDESIRPVEKKDIAEVLRRRFFTLDSIRDREAFRPHVTAALKGIQDLDEETRKQGGKAEELYHRSYPFHPGLTDVFYEKWTGLEDFQQARGVLRIMALAIRDARAWDDSPLISTNAFLSKPGAAELSKAASELADIATKAQFQGQREGWANILEGELKRVREVQERYPALDHREVEQIMFGVFLHSQPKGHKAPILELMRLVGHTRPDKIELEQALRDLLTTSWFLDEEYYPDKPGEIPREWRLGSKPNLTQMHDEARSRIEDLVEPRLLDEIRKTGSLKAGASGAGAQVHMLPSKPGDVKDDGAFHYAVLGPDAASSPGHPSELAERFLFETTSADRPRVNKNAIVLAVPSPDGLEAARNRIRDYLGWEEVRNMLKDQPTDPVRDQRLSNALSSARGHIEDAVTQAYSVAVTVGRNGDVEAFKVPTGEASLFASIKNHDASRIKESAITPETILPGGPYDLWREDEPSRRVPLIAEAFAQRTDLPKMLRPQAIYDTIALGCEAGAFVLQLSRPDGSIRTIWRARPDEAMLRDPSLEAVLPEHAELSQLDPVVLKRETLPGLWQDETLPVSELYAYFGGSHIVEVERDGYSEAITIPKADEEVVVDAVRAAVERGILWLRTGQGSLYGESVPEGAVTEDAKLKSPPEAIPATELLPIKLEAAWSNGSTTAAAIGDALSEQHGEPLPWPTIQQTIDSAFQLGYMKRTVDSGRWPTDRAGADQVKIRLPGDDEEPKRKEEVHELERPASRPGVRWATASLEPDEIQNLADEVGDLVAAAAAYGIRFHLRVEAGSKEPLPDDVAARLDEVLRRISAKLSLENR